MLLCCYTLAINVTMSIMYVCVLSRRRICLVQVSDLLCVSHCLQTAIGLKPWNRRYQSTGCCIRTGPDFFSCPLQNRMDRTDIGTLLIPNAKASDSGNYMCVGSNSAGSSRASIQVTVIKGKASQSWRPCHPTGTL